MGEYLQIFFLFSLIIIYNIRAFRTALLRVSPRVLTPLAQCPRAFRTVSSRRASLRLLPRVLAPLTQRRCVQRLCASCHASLRPASPRPASFHPASSRLTPRVLAPAQRPRAQRPRAQQSSCHALRSRPAPLNQRSSRHASHPAMLTPSDPLD